MGEVSSIEALNGSVVGNITYQNNIFQDMIRGVNATRDTRSPDRATQLL